MKVVDKSYIVIEMMIHDGSMTVVNAPLVLAAAK